MIPCLCALYGLRVVSNPTLSVWSGIADFVSDPGFLLILYGFSASECRFIIRYFVPLNGIMNLLFPFLLPFFAACYPFCYHWQIVFYCIFEFIFRKPIAFFFDVSYTYIVS